MLSTFANKLNWLAFWLNRFQVKKKVDQYTCSLSLYTTRETRWSTAAQCAPKRFGRRHKSPDASKRCEWAISLIAQIVCRYYFTTLSVSFIHYSLILNHMPLLYFPAQCLGSMDGAPATAAKKPAARKSPTAAKGRREEPSNRNTEGVRGGGGVAASAKKKKASTPVTSPAPPGPLSGTLVYLDVRSETGGA